MRLTVWDKIRELNKPKRILIFVMTFVVSYSILMTTLIPKKYEFEPGDISNEDIKAPIHFKDDSATLRAKKEAESKAEPSYTRKESRSDAKSNIENAIKNVNSILDSNKDEKDRIAKLRVEKSFTLTKEEQYAALARASKEQLALLQEVVVNILWSVLEADIQEKDIPNSKTTVNEKIEDSDIVKEIKPFAKALAETQIKANFVLDVAKTEEAKKAASKEVDDIVIKKGQIIVKEGVPIEEEQIRILKEIGLMGENSVLQWYVYISLGILVLTVLLLQWYYLYRYYRHIFDDCGKLMLISIVNCISLILARTLNLISPYLIPLACAPMLLTLLIDSKVSITLSILNCILLVGVVEFSVEVTLLIILNAVLGSIILKKMQARNDILYSSIYIAILNVVLCFTTGVLLSNDIIEIFRLSGFACIGSIISAVLTIGFLPFFESTFDIVTTIKLLELSNPNHSLLKQLLIEAPGTYHHSILVGNLAEAAAEEVGGNPVLARVGAYYHDVGKIKRPYFFKENQMGNDNPHAKITPNLSTLVITSHVKDGMDLAREANLPRVIKDIIEQHHGTSLVKYFYFTMKNSSENPEEVKEADFRYSGPVPKTKEAGIIMLADSIEAAVRSINEPTNQKIEQMVNDIIRDRLNDGQLDDCDLTLKDLNKMKKAFIKSLLGIYHHRIEYPTDKWIESKSKQEK